MRERDDLPFAMEEYRARLANARAAMAAAGLDAILLFSPENLCYLTGYSTIGYYTYQTLLLPLEGEPVLLVRHLEAANVERQTWLERWLGCRDEDDPLELTRRLLEERGLARAALGIEEHAWWLTVREYKRLAALVPSAGLRDCTGLVERLRVRKSAAEVAYIRRAADIAGRALAAGLERVAEGRSENEVAAEIQAALTRLGSVYVAAPVFAVSGPDSGYAHATWEGRTIRRGDVLFFEVGACVQRYHAAQMRSACVGEPTEQVRRAAEASIAGLDAAIAAIGPGVRADDVDRAARGTIERLGFGAFFHQRTGYSIGLGYPPTWTERGMFSLNRGDADLLEPGMVFHVIPALLLPGIGGFGFSETVLVTEHGCEILTNNPRSLRVA